MIYCRGKTTLPRLSIVYHKSPVLSIVSCNYFTFSQNIFIDLSVTIIYLSDHESKEANGCPEEVGHG